MATIDHYLRSTFHLNCAIPLVKALKWSQGEKNSKGTRGNKKEQKEGSIARLEYKVRTLINII